MKLKKVLSGFLSAAILATTTAIVMPMSASAEDTINLFSGSVTFDTNWGTYENVTGYADAKAGDVIKITCSEVGSESYHQVILKDSSWNDFEAGGLDAKADSPSLFILSENDATAMQGGFIIGGYDSTITSVDYLPISATNEAWSGTVTFGTDWSTYETVTGYADVKAGDVIKITCSEVGSDSYHQVLLKDSSYNDFEAGGLGADAASPSLFIISENDAATMKDGFIIGGYDCTISKIEILSVGNAEVAVDSVTLDEATLALKKGEEAQLAATVEPAEADQGITWTTSNNKVATVSADGKVTAVASGTATITATSTADETKTAECEVTVTNPATAIAIDETASVLVGATKLLAVTTTPADADELTYTWTTSNAAVATVADGEVTGVAAGTAKITVTAGTLTASCDVTVTADAKPITELEISDKTLELEEGETGTLTHTAIPADTTDEIEWITSNAKVATVENGVVTAVAEGTATITVQVKGNEEISASCEVTVTAKAPEIETKPYTLNVVDASGWGEAGVTRAAQVNVPVTTLNGFKVGTTTYKDVKDKTLKLENLAFGSCTAAGVKAENVDVCIYLQFGSGWTWCATGGNTLADGSVEYDLSTLASANGVKDTDVLQQIGFQFNIKGNVGGINDMAENTKVTLNAAEPKFTVVGEEPSNYETGKVETVEGYVPASTEAGKKTELVVMSITETEAARNDSYTITVSDGTKTYTTTTNDCYKGFKYNTATGEKTENAANGYFIIVKVTGVPEGTNITVTIEPTK